MTAEEWFATTDPWAMLREAKASERKLRLFACGCVRLLMEPDMDAQLRAGIDAVEQYADARTNPERSQIKLARRIAKESFPRGSLLEMVARISVEEAAHAVVAECEKLDLVKWDWKTGYEARARLLRELFGNPFRPVTFAPEWLTSTVVALAKQMYESWDFGAMPILADALQDAGCDNDDVLNHCRDAHATHVRGCWVVDLVLGKG